MPDSDQHDPPMLDYAAKSRRRRTGRRITGVFGLMASLAGGWQVYLIGMWGLYGAPPNPLHPIALLGTLVLFVASIALISTGGRKAAIVCLIATVPLWIFYGPATVMSILDIFYGNGVFDLISFVPQTVLAAFTAVAAVTTWRHNQSLKETSTKLRPPLLPPRRWGFLSCICWMTMVAAFIASITYSGNSAVIESDSARRLFECRLPAGFAALGLLFAAIGIAKDKRKMLAIVGVVINLVAMFVLLTLDAAVGMPGP
jgi:hypothetical protein